MYQAGVDPYCYPGTTVLRNLLGLTSEAALEAYELAATMQRASEPLPAGRLSVRHYRAIHRHLFQDVYAWAGRIRSIRLAKGGNAFCYPEHIDAQLAILFATLRRDGFLRCLPRAAFVAGAAQFLAELNAIHAFREGNGRTQLAFMSLLAAQAGHPMDLDRLDPEVMLAAMIASFSGREAPLVRVLDALTG